MRGLRAHLEPIILDESLTKEQRSKKLQRILRKHLCAYDENRLEEAFETWSEAVADIVADNDLSHWFP
jgi:hypothetical protein